MGLNDMASVLFIEWGDCLDFYNLTANGLVYKLDNDPKERVAFVEMGKDVDVIGGILQLLIDTDTTRCVIAIGGNGVDLEGFRSEIEEMGIPVEHIEEGVTDKGVRFLI